VLTFLSISNLAVISRLELELEPGLTVITGETGAGKSMLLAGLTALLGDRIDPEMVRDGADQLVVEGAFEGQIWKTDALVELLDEEPREEIIVRRTVRLNTSRRDRLQINGRLIGRARLYNAAADLVSIASQHEYVGLLKKARHVHLLDSCGGHDKERRAVLEAFEEHQRLTLAVEELANRAAQRNERLELLDLTITRLEDAAIEPGEEDSLLEQIDRLAHAVEITRALQEAVELLYESDRSMLGDLDFLVRQLGSVQHYEPALEGPVERLANSRADLEDLVDELRGVLGRLDVDPNLLDHLQERVALLQKLKRRYGDDHSDLLMKRLEEAHRERAELTDADNSLASLRRAEEGAWADYQVAAGKLNIRRQKTAATLCKALQKTLAELAMPGASFAVDIDFDETRASRFGSDRVEFLFSANAGQSSRPLHKVASGGELSRILLAFKAVLAAADPVPTYIFDEIDAGVGGRTALAVGKLLSRLADGQQVLCITHTAQLAAFADQHIVVTKEEKMKETVTNVTVLKKSEERAQELARMLSGLDDSDSALENARELLAAAAQEKA